MTRPTESQGRPAAPAKKTAGTPTPPNPSNPWHALWAMMIGFFMILVDSTIVAVANPSIMEKLQTDYDAVIWVTSAYLLAYAVPLLLAGRLGDQFGPKNLYLTGLFVFTAASLWCGLSGSIETLIAARVLQGIGAALLTPQTLSTITRIFPADRRGAAMSVWGATAGVATLVGPLAGGVLVDRLGWQWIFFVNVPIGIIGLVLAFRLVPVLPTNRHRFDVLGVVLSGAAMFLVVFGLQEGESHHWSAWIWGTIGGGVVAMLAFVYWQAVNKSEPLIPLSIFGDRNFSLANIGVAVIGFAVVAMVVPVMFYAQVVCGLTPTRSALLTAPMAIATGMLAPIVGKIVDRAHPRPIIGFGFSVLAIALTWLSVEMTPTTPIWRLLLPFAAMGVGMAFIWAPLAATATRNLPGPMAGAGSGVYNATRQIGSVLGSAGVAAFMTSRISAEMPGGQGRPSSAGGAMQLPEFLRVPFADALSQTVLLPAFVALFGVVAALFLVGGFGSTGQPSARIGDRRGESDVDDASTEVIPVLRDTSYESPYRREFASQPDMFRRDSRGDWYVDDHDNEYIEFTVDRDPEDRDPDDAPVPRRYAELVTTDDYRADDDYAPAHYADATDYVADDYAADDYGDTDDYVTVDDHARTDDIPRNDMAPDENDTAPMATRVEHPRAAPDDVWHSTPVESWHSLLAEATPADEVAQPAPIEPIGFAHNGFHVDDEKFQPLLRSTPPPERPAPPSVRQAPPAEPPAPAATPAPPVRPPTATPWPQSGHNNGDRYAASFQRLVENIDSIAERYSDALPERQHRYRDSVQNGASAAAYENSSRHSQSDEADVRRPRHYREDPDDLENNGRHSLPWRD